MLPGRMGTERDHQVSEFDRLWRSLFTTPIHLDSALAKLSPELRPVLATLVPELLRRPCTLARRLGLPAVAEPRVLWARSSEELARWYGARELFEALLDAPPRVLSGSASEDDFPPWMVAELTHEWGSELTRTLIPALGARPPVSLRAARRLGREALAEALGGEGSVLAPLGVLLGEHSPVARHPWFAEGSFEIQDEGSQLMSLFALWPERVQPLLSSEPGAPDPARMDLSVPPPPRRGWTVVDACAGAGGKALAIADLLGGRGRVFAYDVSARKLEALRHRAARAGLHNVKTATVEDGAELGLVAEYEGTADVVLVDAPCSGWGVLRRNPDIKWRQREDARVRLPALQGRLLRAYATLVKPGGRLVYGVCTIRQAETRAIVRGLSADHPELEPGPGGFLGPGTSDGFFMQAFTRRA